jgi:NAD(P)H-dependent FMN reductase
MAKTVIAVLAGTARPKRLSIKAAQYVADFGRQLPGVEIIFVDPRELNLPDDGDDPETRDPRYSDITARADAFIIVTPEYNHGYPGSLKRMLDSEYDNYYHKPVALAGVSNGPWGGARVCEALLPVLHKLGMLVAHKILYFPKVQDIFDDDGKMKLVYGSRYQKNLAATYNELIQLAQALKEARKK